MQRKEGRKTIRESVPIHTNGIERQNGVAKAFLNNKRGIKVKDLEEWIYFGNFVYFSSFVA